MGKFLALVYGVASYVFFLVTFLYSIAFIGNLYVPKSIDSGAEPFNLAALLINLGLLGIFSIQHSIMARLGFKRWWTRIVPQPIERSTYVLFATLALALMLWQWRGISGIVWSVKNPTGVSVIWVLFGMGWAITFASTFMIDHFDLFGVRQVVLYAAGKSYSDPEFQTRGFYRYLRHPILSGTLIAFWAVPVMTVGHLLFSVVTTVYIFIGVALEERDLEHLLGEPYRRYRRSVPMMIPFARRSSRKNAAS